MYITHTQNQVAKQTIINEGMFITFPYFLTTKSILNEQMYISGISPNNMPEI